MGRAASLWTVCDISLSGKPFVFPSLGKPVVFLWQPAISLSGTVLLCFVLFFLYSWNPIKVRRRGTYNLGWVNSHFLALLLNKLVSSSLLTFVVNPWIPFSGSPPCLYFPADFPNPSRSSLPDTYLCRPVFTLGLLWFALSCCHKISCLFFPYLTGKWSYAINHLIPLPSLFSDIWMQRNSAS